MALNKLITGFFLVSVLLGGSLAADCSETSSPEQTRTVEWYLQNKAELKKKIAECADNPGELGNTPNCINAKAAILADSAGAIHDLPPDVFTLQPKKE